MLVQLVCRQGAHPRRLVAHAAGGANVMDPCNSFDIGKRNYLALRRILWKAGILLAAEACGGKHSRTVRLEISSGRFWLHESGEQRELEISDPRKGAPEWVTVS
jgi:chemotaxis protein CheD